MYTIAQSLRQLCCISPQIEEPTELQETSAVRTVSPQDVHATAPNQPQNLAVDLPASENIHAISVEKRNLFAGSFHFRHPRHGNIEIFRVAKSDKQNTLDFKINLSGKGVESSYIQRMYVTDRDDNYNNASTLGYSDIFLPMEMQHRGIIYLLHFAAAESVLRLGADKFVVDNVVSAEMHKVCQNLGLKEDGIGFGYYSGAAEGVKERCIDYMHTKGWMRMPEVMPDAMADIKKGWRQA
ncbi:hypothetical protein [Kosakonia sp. MUSA4]|uniref:hypothetical protein n=1 Tax=Kosakonia sp. MUSA4 TaxID=2067958 RepID=UPI001AC0028B|nr:hypothetical protein [Kosakonia sp. MUSA4]